MVILAIFEQFSSKVCLYFLAPNFESFIKYDAFIPNIPPGCIPHIPPPWMMVKVISRKVGVKSVFFLWRKNQTTTFLKTKRFDKMDLAVIISSVSKAVQTCLKFHFPVLYWLANTADDDRWVDLSKRPVLGITEALFFLLKLFSSHIYRIIPRSVFFAMLR